MLTDQYRAAVARFEQVYPVWTKKTLSSWQQCPLSDRWIETQVIQLAELHYFELTCEVEAHLRLGKNRSEVMTAGYAV